MGLGLALPAVHLVVVVVDVLLVVVVVDGADVLVNWPIGSLTPNSSFFLVLCHLAPHRLFSYVFCWCVGSMF